MSDPILHLSIWQSPVFLLNSRLGLFTAALNLTSKRPFSRSYGAILPSSLTMIHSSALGYSPRLPVSVCGTSCYTRFSWKLTQSTITSPLLAQCTIVRRLQRTIPSVRVTYIAPSLLTYSRYGNINPFSISFAFRLRLRSRLTLF